MAGPGNLMHVFLSIMRVLFPPLRYLHDNSALNFPVVSLPSALSPHSVPLLGHPLDPDPEPLGGVSVGESRVSPPVTLGR